MSATFPGPGLHLQLSRFTPENRTWWCLTFSFDCLLFRPSPIHVPSWPGAAGLHLRLSRFPAVTHPTADRARCCLTFSVDCLFDHPSKSRPGTGSPLHLWLSRRSPIPLPIELGAALPVIHLRRSSIQVPTRPRCCWTSSSAVSFSGDHPSHCRPSPVLLDLFLRLSPLPVVTHPSADPDWCWWTLSSVVPFSAVTNPNADRVRRCLIFFFDCLLFRM